MVHSFSFAFLHPFPLARFALFALFPLSCLSSYNVIFSGTPFKPMGVMEKKLSLIQVKLQLARSML